MNSNPLIFRFVANRLRDMSKIALILSFVSVALLGCGGGGGGGGLPPLTLPEATAGADTFTIADANIVVGSGQTHTLNSAIDGLDGADTFELGTRGVVAGISFNTAAPTGGNVHLQNIETITINGGTVNGAIDTSDATAGVTFNLNSGMVGSVTGSDNNVDNFVIGSGITVSGTLNGGDGDDTISLASGFTPASANLFGGRLTLTLTGGGSLTFTLVDIEDTSAIAGLTMMDLGGGPADNGNGNGMTTSPALPLAAGTPGGDIFEIASNIVGPTRTHTLNVVIDAGDGADTLELNANGVVRNILFSGTAPSDPSLGDVHLQSVEEIHINGGTVNGDITGSSVADEITLQDGTIRGNVVGGDGFDLFRLYSAIRFVGTDNYIDGGGGTDTLAYAGAGVATDDEGNPITDVDGNAVANPAIYFAPRGGLAEDFDTSASDGTDSVRGFSFHTNSAVIDSLSVRNIESLALSPALNLYGALSDALMQFGQQTAQGFALADLNPQTGRVNQLISKASPFTKGRIWAHKITHSGNGKGSIGLNLTGLTARAPSDYDYEMSLTQHGFDAPVVSSQWGDFGLRAVSHTMTGTIETNTAEAQVSGYGAGASLLWRSRELRSLPRHHNLTAHITALAGGYEVDAHTSPSNPQAVVNEVSEGSFSAINAVISAGVADKRELANGLVIRTTADVSWQTLSLDDFTETGQNGIIINFDKATRFTARIGAGLEGEHWFSDIAFVHETSSGGTLSSGLRQDYRQHDGTAIEMKLGGKMADLTPGLTIKAFAVWRQSVAGLAGEPSAQFDLSYRF